MLTLEPAFTASHRVQLISTIMHVEATRPRKLEPLIPRDLETIVLKAIAKSPSDRFASASELARELGRFVDGRPIRSRRVSAPERLWRWSRRNPAVALLTVLAGVLTTALAITSTTAAWRFREQRDEVLEQRDSVQKQQQNTQVQLARSLLQQVRAERYSRQPRPRDERLERLAEAARLARAGMAGPDLLTNLRGEAIATLGEGDLRGSKTWPGLNLDQAYSSFAFDADRYVRLDGGRSFHLCRISDRSENPAGQDSKCLGPDQSQIGPERTIRACAVGIPREPHESYSGISTAAKCPRPGLTTSATRPFGLTAGRSPPCDPMARCLFTTYRP